MKISLRNTVFIDSSSNKIVGFYSFVCALLICVLPLCPDSNG